MHASRRDKRVFWFHEDHGGVVFWKHCLLTHLGGIVICERLKGFWVTQGQRAHRCDPASVRQRADLSQRSLALRVKHQTTSHLSPFS